MANTALNAEEVYVGIPDQQTTGAIMCAPLGTVLPTSAKDTIAEAFKGSGYVSEDGLTLSTDYSTSEIKEWSGAIIRKILEQFDGTISWKEISLNYESACHAFGDEHVTKTDATADSGNQLKISIGAHMPAAKSWVFKMKDGDRRMLVVVPNGQVTAMDGIDFKATDAVGFPLTLSCYDDGTGNSIYIYTDDGKVVSA